MLFYRLLLSISTSNNQRLRSAGDNDRRSNAFAPTLYFAYVSPDRRSKTRVIRLRVKEGPYARDQIALYTFHSFLAEVQTNAGYINATHV